MNLPRFAVTSCRRRMPRAVPPSGLLGVIPGVDDGGVRVDLSFEAAGSFFD